MRYTTQHIDTLPNKIPEKGKPLNWNMVFKGFTSSQFKQVHEGSIITRNRTSMAKTVKSPDREIANAGPRHLH